ncbi:MAG: hypothetical protein J0I09_03965 [Sphingobacteriia bacterium]|nr:hypothetical protein [Sphingobacteriia bacterium]
MLKKFFSFMAFMAVLHLGAQTPVNMSVQSNFTYTETFSDINNWTFASSGGTFTNGIGASAWRGSSTVTGVSIPDGVKITTATTSFTAASTGGVQKGSNALMLLSTGTSDNSSSAAMDFFLDFTGLNAGTLSFDWASVNNSAGDRKGSLRVYASTDGNNFTEITAAQVLNFTNNVLTSGSITSVNLPSSFNGSSSARIRFYYYNGTGGTTGSRPKISITNVKVTAISTVSCTTPSDQPTSLNFNTTTSASIAASFTAAASAPDHYLILAGNNTSLSSLPVNGVAYAVGDNIGDAAVVAVSNTTSFTATSLSPLTTYYFFIFSVNQQCNGGPLYQTTLPPLTGNQTTITDAVPCAVPAAQPTSLNFSNIGFSSLQGRFTGTAADEYLIVRSQNSSLSALPVNGNIYNQNDVLGGGVVVSRGANTSFVNSSLNASTTYYYFIFSINSQSCTGGPLYNTVSPLTASVTTTNGGAPCSAPSYQPGNFVVSKDNTSISGSFSNAVDADGYIVLYSTTSSLSQLPQNNTDYTVGNNLGNATVGAVINNTNFYLNGLNASTTYYVYVFAKNSACSGGTKYNLNNPLTASITTNASANYNYYFGNLHAHSHYSDGNKDNATYTPADDYAYAKSSLNLDFLGISEHNHSGAGMSLSSYALGVAQANAATTSNFLALYGQEWGVISNGGHVLVYGIDSLIGWEPNNYKVFVAKSDYTGTLATTGTVGLFAYLRQQGNAFASYAHPNSTDYNNIASQSYNAMVDSVVIGCAVESGLAFSTNTTYSDPPSSMGFLSYYTKMLAKGYHLGPFMDHDTHYTNFGRANQNRLVVLASSLTKADLFAALKARRFYATEDMDTRISFTLNNQVMGSIFSGSSLPSINISANDPTSPGAVPLIKLMKGVPGSGIAATQVASFSGNNFSYIDNNLVNGSSAYYYADITINGKRTISAPVWYSLNSCAVDANNPMVTWVGGTGTGTGNANNWCSGTVPPSGSNMIINASAATMPVLQAGESLVVNNLTVPAGASFKLNGGTLTVTGAIANNGTLDLSKGTLILQGSSAQTLPAVTNTLQNLVINNGAGVTLVNPLTVTGTISPVNGVLNTNGNLLLASTANGSAAIGQGSGNYLNGNATVQRFIGNSNTWRMIGFPFTNVTAISASDLSSQFGAGYNAYVYDESRDDQVNYGNSGSANAGWVQFTGGSATTSGNAILLKGGAPASTISFTGPLNAGMQSIGLSKNKSGWNFISNPFASNIDWSTVYAANNTTVAATVYRYDPNTTAYASYNALTTSQSGNQNKVIENGAGFFVQALNAGTLSIRESDKTNSAASISMMGVQGNGNIKEDGAGNSSAPEMKSIIKLSLSKQGDAYADEVIVRWGGGFMATDSFDTKYDAYDLGRNTGPDLSVIGKDAIAYSIYHGSELKNNNDEKRVLQLGMKNIAEGVYQVNMQLLSALNYGNMAYLHDKYTNQYILIDGNHNYIFLVTAEPSSQDQKRFSIVLNYQAENNVVINNNYPVSLLNNPVSANTIMLYCKKAYSQLQWQLIDNSGRLLQNGQFNNVLQGSTQIIGGVTGASGNYFIKLNGDGELLPVLRVIKM